MTRITKWRLACALLAIVVVATLPLTVAFRRGLLDMLPLLVLLACPLMHFLMHRRHGSDEAHAAEPSHAMRDEPAVAPLPPYAGRALSAPTATRWHGHTHT